jgi:hypothetical protein
MTRALPIVAVALLVPALLASCMVSVSVPGESAHATGSATGASERESESEIAASETDHHVPAGVFASVEALCTAQKALVAARFAELRKEREENGVAEVDSDVPSSPRCGLAEGALAKVDVKLRAPFLEVRAISVETGDAVEEHLVVLTAEGWRALPHAHIADYHMDPGCFSIERETGLVAVRVEGSSRPALVLVEGTDRGARMEDEVPGQDLVTWDDVTRRAVACRLDVGGTTCDAPVVLRVERIPSTTAGGRTAKLRFETTYAVDAAGRVQPIRKIEDAHLSHED